MAPEGAPGPGVLGTALLLGNVQHLEFLLHARPGGGGDGGVHQGGSGL